MKLLPGKKFKWYIFLLVIISGMLYLLFNESGLVKYFSLKSQVDSLKQQIQNVDAENKNLEGAIDSLQRKIPAKIEKTAREKYNMIRPGEKTIRVEEK